jgi:hypothetical protein
MIEQVKIVDNFYIPQSTIDHITEAYQRAYRNFLDQVHHITQPRSVLSKFLLYMPRFYPRVIKHDNDYLVSQLYKLRC